MRWVLVWVFLLVSPALADVVNIADLQGFTRSGVAGTAGNGYLFLSPVYFFVPGSTIDFGTATVMGDYFDGRSTCFLTNNCINIAGAFKPFFLVDGLGGIQTGAIDLPSDAITLCRVPYGGMCDASIFRLLFTMPDSANSLQLGFQGTSLSITPPIQTPLSPTALLFALGLLAIASTRFARG